MSIKLIFASTAAFALLAGTPAFAAKSGQDEQASASESGGGDQARAERKTCKYFDNTATRMKRQRLCLTREQWRKFEETQAD